MKYYWLKLQKDFFKRHDVRIVEGMTNGKDYVLFYLKMLVESITHEGALRFSESIPYDAEMLSIITNTNVDIVKSAVKIFTELGLMDVFDDGTIYMQEIQKMIGCETEWAEKKREYRSNELCKKDNVRTKKDNVRQEKEKEKDIDIYNVFISLWKLYPNKKGLAQVSNKSKKAIYNIGYDKFKQCIERYEKHLKENPWKKPQNGSTFFNSGYVDYLDENYTLKNNSTNPMIGTATVERITL